MTDSTTDGLAQDNLQQYNARPDGHVNHGGPILDRHDYREWVEWTGDVRPAGARFRSEWVEGEQGDRTFIHPDDVPTDPDAELVERVASALVDVAGLRGTTLKTTVATDYLRTCARGVIALVRTHDKADR
jgi:hypothetical protein